MTLLAEYIYTHCIICTLFKLTGSKRCRLWHFNSCHNDSEKSAVEGDCKEVAKFIYEA